MRKCAECNGRGHFLFALTTPNCDECGGKWRAYGRSGLVIATSESVGANGRIPSCVCIIRSDVRLTITKRGRSLR